MWLLNYQSFSAFCFRGLATGLPLGSHRICHLWRPPLFWMKLRTQTARPDLGNESSALMESDPAGQRAAKGAREKLGAQGQPPGLGGSLVPGVGARHKQQAGKCVLPPLRLLTAVAVKKQSSDLAGQPSLVTQLKRGPLSPSSPKGAPGTPLDPSSAGFTECPGTGHGSEPTKKFNSLGFLRTRSLRKGKP